MSPFQEAKVVNGGVLVPTSGVVQSANILPLAQATMEMHAILCDWMAWLNRETERECIVAVEQRARALLRALDNAEITGAVEYADGVLDEIESLRARLAEQEARVKELEGALTLDKIDVAIEAAWGEGETGDSGVRNLAIAVRALVDAALASTPAPVAPATAPTDDEIRGCIVIDNETQSVAWDASVKALQALFDRALHPAHERAGEGMTRGLRTYGPTQESR